MAERTLVELRDEASAPSSVGTVGVVAEAFVRFVSTHGPYKTETLLFQQAAANDFAADDTIKSQLAHPLFATVVVASDHPSGATALIAAVEVNSLESDSNFKTITLRDALDLNGLGLVITVYGY